MIQAPFFSWDLFQFLERKDVCVLAFLRPYLNLWSFLPPGLCESIIYWPSSRTGWLFPTAPFSWHPQKSDPFSCLQHFVWLVVWSTELVGHASETQGFLASVCYNWVLCSWCTATIASRPLSISFLATRRNNYPDIMKWVVLKFHFRWHQSLMQLVSLNTFCLNKPCSWKWFQNSLFPVAVPLLLFLKMFS